MTPETRLVLALSRTPLPDAAREIAVTIVAATVNWNQVFAIASAFEVEPVFCSNLVALSVARIPDNVLTTAAIRGRESRAFALAGSLVLIDVVAQLEAARIPVIVLKGPALGVMAYGDASMRTFRDIDLLVAREDALRARDVLLQLGYERDYDLDHESDLLSGDHALEFSHATSKVELHCELLERYLRFDLEINAVWAGATVIEIAGRSVRVLDPARLMVFICAHGAKHQWTRVRWICDVAQLAPRLSPDEVMDAVNIAEAARGRGILGLGLRLINEIFGDSVSAFSLLPTAASRRTDALAYRVLRRLGLSEDAAASEGWLDRIEPDARALLFWASSRESWIDRVASVTRIVFVPTAKDRHAGNLARITRPLRLSIRLVRGLFRRTAYQQRPRTS